MSQEIDRITPTAEAEVMPTGNVSDDAIDLLMRQAQAMETAHKLAVALCSTDMVPKTYKGKPENGERCLGEAVAHVREMCALGIDAAKDLERHRCTHEFAESVRERLHLVPLSLARTTCCLSDEKEQERCNRQCHKKEQRREWVCKRRDNEDQRDEHCARNHRW